MSFLFYTCLNFLILACACLYIHADSILINTCLNIVYYTIMSLSGFMQINGFKFLTPELASSALQLFHQPLDELLGSSMSILIKSED